MSADRIANVYILVAVAAANVAVLVLNLFVLTSVLVFRKWRCNCVGTKMVANNRWLVVRSVWTFSRN